MTNETTKGRSVPNGDDLTLIDGIGPETVKSLNAAGVSTFADLAGFASPDELHQRLVEQGVSRIGNRRIASSDWLGQARTHLGRQTESVENTMAVDQAFEEISRKHADFTLFFDYRDERHGEQAQWATTACDNGNGTEVKFDGTDPSQWARWILERAQLPVPDILRPSRADTGEPAPETPADSKRDGPDARLEIAAIDVYVPTPDSLATVGELDVEVSFRIAGIDARALAATGTPYRVELHLANTEDGVPRPVVLIQGRFQPGVVDYTERGVFGTPNLGRYQTTALLYGLPPSDLFAQQPGPALRVVQAEDHPEPLDSR